MNRRFSWPAGMALLVALVAPGCRAEPGSQPAAPVAADAPQSKTPAAPAPETTGGFDGARAFAHVKQLVEINPRVPDTEGIRRAQAYIRAQLESFGCAVEEDKFSASTPVGPKAMKNIVAKVPGASPSIVLFLTHYDTKDIPGFVGANDSGSSTGVMLELARLLCGKKNSLTVWIAFLDGEESFGEWSETDSLYGSRQLAARMALSGDLKRTKAAILADMVGYREPRFRREANSTEWLKDLIWSTAARLGYQDIFIDETTAAEDDHIPFIRRDVPAVDIIQLDDYPYWHTPEDTLDKVSPRTLAIVGHVLLEVLSQLQKDAKRLSSGLPEFQVWG